MIEKIQNLVKNKKVQKGSLMHIAIVAVFVLLAATVWHCPIKLLFGIPCPGCGTTRACLSLLRMNIRDAFMYQPVFFLNVLLFWYCIHRNIIRRNWIGRGRRWREGVEISFLCLALAVVLLVYLVRLVCQASPVMEIHLDQGMLFRMAGLLREMI